MTDRIQAFTVTLDKDIREDDVEVVITAIYMIRHVLSVEPHVAGLDAHVARQRVRRELHELLFAVLNPELQAELDRVVRGD